MIINQPKSDFPLKTKANKRLLPATILGYSQIKFIFSRHVHVYVKPNQDHLWHTKCGSVQELAAPAPRQGLCPLCATSSAWLGAKPTLWMTNCCFHHRTVKWWDVMASRTLANMPGTSLLPEEGGEGAGLLAWLKKLRFVCSPCCNASLLWCLSASSALCEAFLDTLLHGELAKEGSGKKKEKQLPSHWRGGGEGDKKTLPTNSEINTAQFNN